MTITVMGKEKKYPDNLTVRELIEKENVESPLYVTVSVNDQFIKRETFQTAQLHNGDTVEFLYFMGGGT